jgi:hypothetical protein
MWQARCLGPHCRETSKLLKTLSSRKAELLQSLKARKKTGQQSETKEPGLKSSIMKSTLATTPPFLQTPSCAGKSRPYAHSASIAPSYFRQMFGRGYVRPHFLGRGVLSRNITHLAPLRLVELKHCPAKSEPKRSEGSPKATANGVVRDASDYLLDKQGKTAEQQMRFQSNQAVQRQEEAFQDFEEFGRLWPQGSDVRGKLRELLAREKGNGELAQRLLESGYWQKRRGRDWGLFESDRGSARQEGGEVAGAVGQILDEREEEAASAGSGGKRQVKDEGRTEEAFGASSSITDSETLDGEAEESVPGVQGDRSRATSVSAASVSHRALSEGGLVTLSEPDLEEEEGVRVAGAEVRESSEAGVEAETRRGRPPVPQEKRHWAQLRRRQHKMEAMALNNAVERYAKMLKEVGVGSD